jgi:hypothetical protein
MFVLNCVLFALVSISVIDCNPKQDVHEWVVTGVIYTNILYMIMVVLLDSSYGEKLFVPRYGTISTSYTIYCVYGCEYITQMESLLFKQKKEGETFVDMVSFVVVLWYVCIITLP